ncbi:ankyrin repeat-containing domain protein [Cadophora sp. MPI-SDFR-AT-0126]|nr:ankyrin repeat-containing domain protein [Leotiomycetes sp. MPI-SDFR-AT-0126]
MSFGFGVGDFIAVGKLAWSVYKSCKDAPESFNNISAEVLSLHAVLKEVEEALVEEPLTESKQRSLTTISNGCQSVLEDLQALVVKYHSLGSKSRRTWDRMKWGAKDISELRARLTSNTMLLNTFLMTSQVMTERKLNKLVQEFHDGKHEGSVITVATVESLAPDEKETWRAIRKELENIGISVLAFDANKTFIMDWFQTAIRSGAFEEQMIDSDHASLHSNDATSTDSRPFLSHTTPDRDFMLPQYLDSHPDTDIDALGDVEILERSVSNTKRPVLNNENEARNSDLQLSSSLLHVVEPEISDRKTPRGHPRPARVPRLASLMARVLGYDTAFLEACQARNIEKANALLLKGADVNSTRYFTTALGHAARNGDGKLATLLIDFGAALNLASKDGWSPLAYSVSEISDDHKTVAEMLLQAGADVRGDTAQGYARHQSSKLWARGYGRPIYVAAEAGNEEAVTLLVKHGARWKDSDGFNPLHVAEENGFDNIVKILLQHRSTWEETSRVVATSSERQSTDALPGNIRPAV